MFKKLIILLMWSRHLILQDLQIKLLQFIQVLQTILHNKKYVITWNMNPVNQLLFNNDNLILQFT